MLSPVASPRHLQFGLPTAAMTQCLHSLSLPLSPLKLSPTTKATTGSNLRPTGSSWWSCARQPPLRARITCMASPRRVKMVAKQIRRELSDMLLTDKVLHYAVLPEASLGADQYLSSLTTISDVEVSGDLQVVKVYVSVFGDERGKEVAIAGLKAKTKYIRSELGRRMKLRLTPEIRFLEDESSERGSRVIAILDRLKEERENTGVQGEDWSDIIASPDDIDRDEDDPDEGVFYVK